MLSEICVRRPVFATMLVMSLVVLGIFSFRDLGVDLFPKADPATVNVNLQLPGASRVDPDDVVLVLEEHAEGVDHGIAVERLLVERGERRRPVERLGHPGILEQALPPEPLDEGDHLPGQPLARAGHAGADDLELTGEVRRAHRHRWPQFGLTSRREAFQISPQRPHRQ